MGLFYARQETKDHIVFTIRPRAYIGLLVLIAANLVFGFANYDQLNFYSGMLVFALAIIYTVEAWPLIKANFNDQVAKKTGDHLLSLKNPLSFYIKK